MKRLLWVGLALAMVSSAALVAQDPTLLQESRFSPEVVRAAWTPEMFAAARPLGPVAFLSEKELEEPRGRQVRNPQLITSGALPKDVEELDLLERQLFPVEWLDTRLPMVVPTFKDQGPAKLPYTSSRLTPLAADREFPFRTVGRLFFSVPGGTATCSGTVIAPRVVSTAGHCIHSGAGGLAGFFMLGYPASLDGGEILHVVASSSSRKAAAKTVVYGSDMTPGSSGGPWVMNLGDPAAGQGSGPRNLIVGVTSYLTGARVLGSSVPDAGLVQLYNVICARQAGNCG